MLMAAVCAIGCQPEDPPTLGDDARVDMMAPRTDEPDMPSPGPDMSPACVPDADAELCEVSSACGLITVSDNCGTERELDCGECSEGSCVANSCEVACVPEPDAALCATMDATCGLVEVTDSCGTTRQISCGGCADSSDLCARNTCVCSPETDQQLCGVHSAVCGPLTTTDRCGEVRELDCGACAEGTCEANNSCSICQPLAPAALCAREAATCGQVITIDNCGDERALTCGACDDDERCDDSNLCVCVPESDDELCGRAGATCGELSSFDNCGEERTVSCGACDADQTCTAASECVCVPEPAPSLCARLGATCGEVSTFDNCGSSRSLDCGVCGVGEACGQDNQCACAPESDAAFCARVGAACGEVDDLDNCGAQRTVDCGGCAANLWCTRNQCEGTAHIVAGADSTCAVTTSGQLKCWGDNYYTQLGFGQLGAAPFSFASPQRVPDRGFSVASLSIGREHACAVTALGGIRCWGRNSDGQLGDGTWNNPTTPVTPIGLGAGVAQVTVGGTHTCALTSQGAAKCWGRNDLGMLGDGTYTERYAPVDVFGSSSGVVEVSAGVQHSCALLTSGRIECWGYGEDGQLGYSTPQFSYAQNLPRDATYVSSGLAHIEAGAWHSCGITPTGGVDCWGWNHSYQVNDATHPVGFDRVVVGDSHTCALTTTGAVQCWGANLDNQLGIGGVSGDHSVPVDVLSLSAGVRELAAGSNHTCVLMTDGAIKCWGKNDRGQLGNGTTMQSASAPLSVLIE